MPNMLDAGIIGCGNISTKYLEFGSLFEGYQIVACADLNEQAAKMQADEFNVKALTVDALLARDDIQIVINLTVPDAHAEITLRALQAGKHVYSEKPLVLDRNEGAQMQTLAKQKGLLVGSAPDTFLGGAHQLARQVIDSGQLGTITSGTCHVMSHGMERWHPNPDFFFQPGAGPILDIGPYYIANLINLIGPIKRVAALANRAADQRIIGNGDRLGETIPVDTPTNLHALLEFHSGAVITLTASWDVWSHEHNNMELYGTLGSLYVPDPNFFAGTVRIAGDDGEPTEVPAMDHPFNVINEEHEEGDRANYRGSGLADMVAAIHTGREMRCSIDHALHAVDVMLSILESGESGAFVDINSYCERPAPLDGDAARKLLA